MSKKMLIGIMTGIILVVAGIGAWLLRQQTPPPASSLEKVTIADVRQLIDGLVYVAFVKDFFKKEGLEVTLQAHPSGKDALQAVIAGTADLATTAETPIMRAVLKGEMLYAMATLGTSDKYIGIVSRRDHGIASPSDLKGKKIGVSKGTAVEFFLDTFLLNQHIPHNEVTIIDVKPEAIVDGVMEGLDAAGTWDLHIAKLQKDLGEKVITFYGEDIYIFTWNIAVMQKYAEQHPETLKKVLRALVQAELFLKESPEQAQLVIADFLKIDPTLLREQWPILNLAVTMDQFLLTMLENQARWALKNSLTAPATVPNFLDFIYLDAIKAVKPEAVTIIQ